MCPQATSEVSGKNKKSQKNRHPNGLKKSEAVRTEHGKSPPWRGAGTAGWVLFSNVWKDFFPESAAIDNFIKDKITTSRK